MRHEHVSSLQGRRCLRPIRPEPEEATLCRAPPSVRVPAFRSAGIGPAQHAQAIIALQHYRGNAFVQSILEVRRAGPHDPVDSRLVDCTIDRLHREKGTGVPLEGPLREEMERVLGRDLGPVRLHTDAAAARASASLNARAFTMGTDVFFAEGRGRDFSSSGDKWLLAHELAHVVQQSRGNLSLTGGRVKMGRVGDSYEREADAVAERAIGAKAEVQGQEDENTEEEETQSQADTLQRQAEEDEEVQAQTVQRQEKGLVDAGPTRGGGRGEGEASERTTAEARAALSKALEDAKGRLDRPHIEALLRHAADCQLRGEEPAARAALDQAAEMASSVLKAKAAGFEVRSPRRSTRENP